MRRRWAWVAALLVVLGLGSALWIDREARLRRFGGGLEEARSALLDGRHATARRRLADLVDRRPGHGEALYLLGLCEQLLGHPDRAEAAWARIPGGTPEAGLALLHWADVEQERGRLAAAEDRLRAALGIPGAHRPMARWSLVLLLRHEGRFDEARVVFRRGLAEHPEPVEAMKILYKLDTDPFPVETARRDLEIAHRLAPEDDRAWLGLAHLATRSGRFDEAEGWLDRCLGRRPGDPAVWRARLDWALAAGRTGDASEALAHLPAGTDAEADALRFEAWFARQDGDREAERLALEALDRIDPSRPEVIDRLAAIAAEEGRTEAAAGYRAVRTRLEEDRDAYVDLLLAGDLVARSRELSRQAAALGRRFDALAWAALADGAVDEAEVPSAPEADVGGASLADLIPEFAPRPGSAGRGASAEGRGEGKRVLVPRFEDDSARAGLDFVHDRGHVDGRLILPETGAGGVGLLDFDGDGRLDLYAVQAGTFPPAPGAPNADRLYRNRGDGTFEDVSTCSGIASMPGGYGHGVAVGDVDDDGDPDLLVTRWRSYALYRNEGDGTFADATEEAGLGGDRGWPTSAAFADLDDDGDLDLYVCQYLEWDEHGDRTCLDPDDPTNYACNPRDFPALPDRVFRNDGGRFVDVTEEAGFVDPDGRGLGVVAADVDGDRRVDLFVANDMTPDYLFLNRGGFRFEEVGAVAGVAANAQGNYQAGMGTACGDLDGDGRLDLLVTNYFEESTSFFRNLGGGYFADQSAEVNLEAPTRELLGFGLALLDANLDGRLDVLSANGHVHDGRPRYPYAMPAHLLLGGPDGRLVDPGASAGPPFSVPHLGRGLAVGDLDDDGRPDAVLQAQDGPLVYLHNRTEDPGRFLVLRLEGTESNRDAVGAIVTVEAGGRRLVASRNGGGSYQSAGDPRLHFGLGDASEVDAVEVDAVEVRWPSGRVDRHLDLDADAAYLLREGSAAPLPLPGFPRADAPEVASGG
ncbi:FG-GAP-like repeat-containing protein [Tautonia plasticadhaerens]|uniref:FG-GAP repeat protein n=1 Tax=Tautonia plasticadhaerens TaxID=2527974 RepID=A0A518HCQ3_9BACT|nr:FG-GAP-like repeat-containing protein [Tautonia plasticadhaerens]QDV38641.1 FG-GAP repeat protein [Tautonia plasticadhaerens]